MSEEENKAMNEDEIKFRADLLILNSEFPTYRKTEAMEELLKINNKQQKEIKELSEKLTEKICKGVEEEILEEYRQTIISKDKEIEELKKENIELSNQITDGYWENDRLKNEIEERETRLQEEINENCRLKTELYGNRINKDKIRKIIYGNYEDLEIILLIKELLEE